MNELGTIRIVYYDGGELVLDTPLGMHSVKLPAGDVVLYPATTLHEVRPVTRGVRLVAVTWVQSWVRDLLAREILADISRAADVLRRKGSSDEESLLLSRAYANLLRREADGRGPLRGGRLRLDVMRLIRRGENPA